MGVALSGGCHALSSWKAYFVEFYGRVAGFWLFDFYDLSRNQFLSYSQFQYVKLKLKSRAFCWCIVCFCISNGFFTILNLVGFSFCLTHPVYIHCSEAMQKNHIFVNSYKNRLTQKWDQFLWIDHVLVTLTIIIVCRVIRQQLSILCEYYLLKM